MEDNFAKDLAHYYILRKDLEALEKHLKDTYLDGEEIPSPVEKKWCMDFFSIALCLAVGLIISLFVFAVLIDLTH